MTRKKYGVPGVGYGFGNDKHDCGCGKKGSHHDDHKKDDKLDEIIDLLKKLLKKKDHCNGNGNGNGAVCDAITVQFQNTGANRLEIEAFVSSSGNTFGCPIVLNQTNIAELTACLYSKGFRIEAFTAIGGRHTYTFVRCS